VHLLTGDHPVQAASKLTLFSIAAFPRSGVHRSVEGSNAHRPILRTDFQGPLPWVGMVDWNGQPVPHQPLTQPGTRSSFAAACSIDAGKVKQIGTASDGGDLRRRIVQRMSRHSTRRAFWRAQNHRPSTAAGILTGAIPRRRRVRSILRHVPAHQG
jgi:hypothetical protein